MGGMFGMGGDSAPTQTMAAPPTTSAPASSQATPAQAVQRFGGNFGPNSQAAGIMYGDPAAALGSQTQAASPGLGGLDDYITAAQEFLKQGTIGRTGAAPSAVISDSFSGTGSSL